MQQIRSAIRDYMSILVEQEFPKKPREFLNQQLEERTQGKIAKELAHDIVNTIYQENEELKKAIWDSVESRIILEHNLSKKKFAKKRFVREGQKARGERGN